MNELLPDAPEQLLGVTKGTHVMLELDGPLPTVAITTTEKSDGRVFFAIPRDEMLLVGTTDDRFDAAPGTVRPHLNDVTYLLAEAQALLPGQGINQHSVRYAYAGLRPLQRSTKGPEATITRRHQVVEHGEHGGPTGLMSLVGGKLSTARPFAREVFARPGILEGPRKHRPPPRTRMPEEQVGRLAMYGTALSEISKTCQTVLCLHSGLLDGEIVHSLKNEHADTLSDALLRRTGAAWASCRALCNLETVADVAAATVGWDDARKAAETAAFRDDVSRHLPTISELDP